MSGSIQRELRAGRKGRLNVTKLSREGREESEDFIFAICFVSFCAILFLQLENEKDVSGFDADRGADESVPIYVSGCENGILMFSRTFLMAVLGCALCSGGKGSEAAWAAKDRIWLLGSKSISPTIFTCESGGCDWPI